MIISKKFVLNISILSILSLNLNAQYTDNYNAYISTYPMDSLQAKVIEFQKFMENKHEILNAVTFKNAIIKEIKDISDFLFYRNLWENYKIEVSKDKRIEILHQMMIYKYSLINDRHLNENA